MTRYRIVPKRDFGAGPGFLLPHVPGGIGTLSYGFVKSGWIVTNGFVNVMPGACWFRSIDDACRGIRALEASAGDPVKFWDTMHAERCLHWRFDLAEWVSLTSGTA